MDGTIQIVSAALTTGTLLGPAGARIASDPSALALTTLLLVTALALAALAAWRSATAPVRFVPPGPALPKLHRRIHGPRDRRA